jgi:hypothetical protein
VNFAQLGASAVRLQFSTHKSAQGCRHGRWWAAAKNREGWWIEIAALLAASSERRYR